MKLEEFLDTLFLKKELRADKIKKNIVTGQEKIKYESYKKIVNEKVMTILGIDDEQLAWSGEGYFAINSSLTNAELIDVIKEEKGQDPEYIILDKELFIKTINRAI